VGVDWEGCDYELSLSSPEAYGVRVGFLPRSDDGCRLTVQKLQQ
jgi:hypothetical protein